MRYFIFLPLLFLAGCINPSRLAGKYYESYGAGWGGATYTFDVNGKFTYVSHYDVGGQKGNGNYSVCFGKLKMEFTPWADTMSQSFVNVNSDTSRTEFPMVIRLHSKDTASEDVIGAIIRIMDSSGTAVAGGQTDIDGKAILRMNGDLKFPLKMEVKCIGYSIATSVFSTNGSYNCEATMVESDMCYAIDSGIKWKYRIRHEGYAGTGLQLKPIGNTVNDGIGKGRKHLSKQ